MKISVVGTGYVGLVTGACLSDYGNDVYCVDVDEKKIEDLKKGIISIFEPGLEGVVRENYDAGRLRCDNACSRYQRGQRARPV